MELYALDYAENIPEMLGGCNRLMVHSVYDNTINLSVDGRKLVSLLSSDGYLHPFAIRLPMDNLKALGEEGSWQVDKEALTTPSGQRISLQHGNKFSSFLPRREEELPAKALCGTLRRCCQSAGALSPLGFLLFDGPKSPLAGWGAPIEEFSRAALQGDAAAALTSAEGLLGLGWGLTPSFDDYCVGLLSAIWGWGSLSRSRYIQLCTGLTEMGFSQTSMISANFLFHAVGGCFSHPVLDVVSHLSGGDMPAATQAVQRLLMVGHSSGADTLTGILFGFELIAK